MLPEPLHQQQVLQVLYSIPQGLDPAILSVEMLAGDDKRLLVTIAFYPPGETHDPKTMAAIPVVCQVKLLDSVNPLSSSLTSFPQHPTLPSTSNPTATANNLFEELDTTRHTSWQYELTHLRIANKNLLDDIAKLEIEQGLREPEPDPQSPDDGTDTSGSRPKKRNRPDAESTETI